MLDKKYVTFYARSSKVRLDVAERDVVLTSRFRCLHDCSHSVDFASIATLGGPAQTRVSYDDWVAMIYSEKQKSAIVCLSSASVNPPVCN